MKKIIIAVVALGLMMAGIYYIAKDNLFLKNRVYSLLEKEQLTSEEMEVVNAATDPDIVKEGYVVLDEKHAALYEMHFGHKR